MKTGWKLKKEKKNGYDGFRQINVSKSQIGEKTTVRTVTNHTVSTVLLPIGPFVYYWQHIITSDGMVKCKILVFIEDRRA